MINALWLQCIVVIILIVVPLLGLSGMDNFFNLLTNLSSLSLAIPYIVLSAAYFAFRSKRKETPFKLFKSRGIALFISTLVFILGVAGFIGSGWCEITDATSISDALTPMMMNYGKPVILIITGVIITRITTYYHNKNKVIKNK